MVAHPRAIRGRTVRTNRVHRSRDPVLDNGWRYRRGPVTRNVTCFAEGGCLFSRNRNSTRVRESLPIAACPRVAETGSAEYLRTNRVRHLARGSCWCIHGRPVRSIGFRTRDVDRLPLCAGIATQRRWIVSSAAPSRWLGSGTWSVRHSLSADVLPITFLCSAVIEGRRWRETRLPMSAFRHVRKST